MIKEDLQRNDLRKTILPQVDIDSFDAKSGTNEEIIVLAFYAIDEMPARDLDSFLERSYLDIVDIEVSPNPNEDNHYVVFVEVRRSFAFYRLFEELLNEIEQVAGKIDWIIRPYYTDKTFDRDDHAYTKYVIVEPEKYMTKKEFQSQQLQNEAILSVLDNSDATTIEIHENKIDLKNDRSSVTISVVDFGDYDTLSRRHKLDESYVDFSWTSRASVVLKNVLGYKWTITPLSECIVLQNVNDENTMLMIEKVIE